MWFGLTKGLLKELYFLRVLVCLSRDHTRAVAAPTSHPLLTVLARCCFNRAHLVCTMYNICQTVLKVRLGVAIDIYTQYNTSTQVQHSTPPHTTPLLLKMSHERTNSKDDTRFISRSRFSSAMFAASSSL